MTRAFAWMIGLVIAASAAGGCVVEPYPGHYHQHGSPDRSYDDENAFYPPPDRHHDHDDYRLPTIVCASKDGRAARCRTDFDIARAEVDKRYSGSPCEYGRSWGFDRNEIWVDRGCRARFVLTPANRWH